MVRQYMRGGKVCEGGGRRERSVYAFFCGRGAAGGGRAVTRNEVVLEIFLFVPYCIAFDRSVSE